MNKKQGESQQFDQQVRTESNFASTLQADELLHELRTYQIELEMQNEELRSAYAALQASRERFRQFYDFAPVGFLTLTEAGHIVEANHTCNTILGVEHDQLINRRFAKFIHPEDADRWHVLCCKAKQHLENQNCELTLRRPNGTVFQARIDYQ